MSEHAEPEDEGMVLVTDFDLPTGFALYGHLVGDDFVGPFRLVGPGYDQLFATLAEALQAAVELGSKPPSL